MTDGRHAKRYMSDEPASEASLLASAFRKPLPVIAAVPLFAVLGLVVALMIGPSYTATAEVLIQDVRASDPFGVSEVARTSAQSSERYLGDQVAVMRSPLAAEIASEILDGRFSVGDILEQTTIDGDVSSNLATISASADDPEDAKAIADAMVAAYAQLAQERLRAAAESALREVVSLIETVETELQRVQSELDDLMAEDARLGQVEEEFDETLAALVQLRVQRDAAPVGSPERAAVNTQIAELTGDLEIWNLVRAPGNASTGLARLTAEQSSLIERRLDLQNTRAAVEVYVRDPDTGIVQESPALLPKEPDGLSPLVILALFVVVGALLGASGSYVLVHRRVRIENRFDPEEFLDAPLLGTIPPLPQDSRTLAVVGAPESAIAYAYRFAASAIDLRTSSGSNIVMVVSARHGSSRSGVVANLVAAAAVSGLRVLAVDADFQTQGLTRFLFGRLSDRGLIDFVFDGSSLKYVLKTMSVGADQELHVMPQSSLRDGELRTLKTDFSGAVFDEVAREHDLIVLDAPAVLEAAYTATLARFVDGLIVVIEDGMPSDEMVELAERLDLTGTPILGYLYVTSERVQRHRPILAGFSRLMNGDQEPTLATADAGAES